MLLVPSRISVAFSQDAAALHVPETITAGTAVAMRSSIAATAGSACRRRSRIDPDAGRVDVRQRQQEVDPAPRTHRAGKPELQLGVGVGEAGAVLITVLSA
jgi:hypothetical protein